MMRASTIGLGVLAVVLAGAIVVPWRAVPPEPPAPRSAATPLRASSAGPGTPDENVRAAWVAAALERPLFTASRRPPAQAAAPAQAGPGGMPRLAGVMSGPFGRRAIFAGPDGGKPLVVQVGDSVAGFRVTAIDDGMVSLQSAERSLRLRPSFATAAGATPATMPPDMPSGLPPGILPEDISNTPPLPGRRP